MKNKRMMSQQKGLAVGLGMLLLGLGGCDQSDPEVLLDPQGASTLGKVASLSPVDSADQLIQRLGSASQPIYPPIGGCHWAQYGSLLVDDTTVQDSPSSASSETSSTSTEPNQSTQNFQVNGVAEADVIAYNSRDLYAWLGQTQHIKRYSLSDQGARFEAKVSVASESQPCWAGLYLSEPAVPNNPLVADTEPDSRDSRDSLALHLLSNHFVPEPREPELTTTDTDSTLAPDLQPVSVELSTDSPLETPPMQHITRLESYSLALEKRRHIEIDAALLASRLVGDDLLLITTRYLPSSIDTTEQLAEALPRIRIDQQAPRALSGMMECLADQAEQSASSNTLVSLITLPLNAPESLSVRCVFMDITALHVSQTALYLASSQSTQDPSLASAVDPSISSQALDSSPVRPDVRYQSAVHKFLLSDLSYRGSAVVPGRLFGGSGQFQGNYLLGEAGGHLVAVSTERRSINGFEPDHYLSVIEDSGNGLQVAAQLPNEAQPAPIGKPGERLFGVRIMHDRAYLVTFQQTDPLYVVDLGNPKQPAITGELEIDGYSGYLHPLPDGQLLGIGKDAVPDANSRFAWYQGIKLSVFDVQDINNPRELSALLIGDRGSQAFAEYNPLAMSLLSREGQPTRLALPVSVSRHNGAQFEPSQSGVFAYSGVQLIDIDQGVLLDRGAIQSLGDRNRWSLLAPRRVVQRDDQVIYFDGDRLFQSVWDNPDAVSRVSE